MELGAHEYSSVAVAAGAASPPRLCRDRTENKETMIAANAARFTISF